MPTLAEKLSAASPREHAGSRTASRYDYQKNFSILKLLELHSTGDDYRALFDFLDDLAVLNCSVNPTTIAFYQIKGQEKGGWSIKQLCEAPNRGSLPRSILGKLYHSALHFGGDVIFICFLTNAPFELKLKSGQKTTDDHIVIAADELHLDDQNAIAHALDTDFPSAPKPLTPDCIPILKFERSPLSLRDSATQVIGHLAKYFEEKRGSTGIAFSALHALLFSRVAERTGFVTPDLATADLLRRKSLTRQEVEQLFKRAESKKTLSELWPFVDKDFERAGVPSVERLKMSRAAFAYVAEQVSGAPQATALSRAVDECMLRQPNLLSGCSTIPEAVERLRNALSRIRTPAYSAIELTGCLGVEIIRRLGGG